MLKFGGSVLRGEPDLLRGVAEIRRWLAGGRRVVAVVSAFEGTTDSLLARAKAVDPEYTTGEHPDAVAMLLATGELTTASLLTIGLKRGGANAALLGPHTLQLRTRGRGADADPASIDAAALRLALEECPVAVVPGFVGVGVAGQFTLLGRGGSDLTALYIAAELGARCRLIKDVAGLYERDPALPEPTPRRYLALSWADALALDGGIVQHKAVRLAQERELSFEVGSFGRDDVSTVGPYRAIWYDAANGIPGPGWLERDARVACAGKGEG